MKAGDDCTYVARSGSETPARCVAISEDKLSGEFELSLDGVWCSIGERSIVKGKDFDDAKVLRDSLTDPKDKDDAMLPVRGKIHKKGE